MNKNPVYYCSGCGKDQECTVDAYISEVDETHNRALVEIKVQCPKPKYHTIFSSEEWVSYGS